MLPLLPNIASRVTISIFRFPRCFGPTNYRTRFQNMIILMVCCFARWFSARAEPNIAVLLCKSISGTINRAWLFLDQKAKCTGEDGRFLSCRLSVGTRVYGIPSRPSSCVGNAHAHSHCCAGRSRPSHHRNHVQYDAHANVNHDSFILRIRIPSVLGAPPDHLRKLQFTHIPRWREGDRTTHLTTRAKTLKTFTLTLFNFRLSLDV